MSITEFFDFIKVGGIYQYSTRNRWNNRNEVCVFKVRKINTSAIDVDHVILDTKGNVLRTFKETRWEVNKWLLNQDIIESLYYNDEFGRFYSEKQ